MMGYCELRMMAGFIFIRGFFLLLFSNSNVKTGCECDTRIHPQRLLSQLVFHRSDFQRGICLTSKLKNTKTSCATSSSLAGVVSGRVSSVRHTSHQQLPSEQAVTWLAVLVNRGECRKELRGRGGQRAQSQSITSHSCLPRPTLPSDNL